MIAADLNELVTAVNLSRSVRDKAPLTEDQASMWVKALRELSLGDCLRALERHTQRSRYLPQPSDVFRSVTGEDEGGTIQQTVLCDERGCGERWCIQTEGASLCRHHYDLKHNTRIVTPDYGGHRWQDLMGALRALDTLSEARARDAYGDATVDYVVANHEQVLALMPKAKAQGKTIGKSLPKEYTEARP